MPPALRPQARPAVHLPQERPLLIRGARQLLTLRSPDGAPGPRRGAAMRSLGLVTDGAVLCRAGLVEEVGPTRRVENLSSAYGAEVLDAAGKVVMPGLVDSLSHPVQGSAFGALARRQPALSPSGPESRREQKAAHARFIHETTRGRLRHDLQRLLHAMIRQGTTTLGAVIGFGQEAGDVYKQFALTADVRIRMIDLVPIFRALEHPGPAYPSPGRYLQELRESILPTLRRRKLAQHLDVGVSDEVFSGADAQALAETGKELGFHLQVLAALAPDSAAELALRSGARQLAGCGGLSAAWTARLAESPTVVTALPSANLLTRSAAPAPLRQLIDQNGAVALGSAYDGQEYGSYGLFFCINLACMQARLTVEEAITAATINSAWALGRSEVGSLEVGKQADLLMLNVPDYREIPSHLGGSLVARTIKRGRVVYQEGEVACPSLE